MKLRKAAAMFTACALVMSAGAFAVSADDAKGCTIDVILKTTSSEYWGYVVAGANAYAKDHPEVTVNVMGATSETAYDEQLSMIETAMSNASVDGYVIAPLQADMVANMIAGQEKPIVAVDTNIVAPEVLSFVGTGNESAAALGGEAAAKLAKERGWEEVKCIEIAGVQGDSTNEARMKQSCRHIRKASRLSAQTMTIWLWQLPVPQRATKHMPIPYSLASTESSPHAIPSLPVKRPCLSLSRATRWATTPLTLLSGR